MYKTLANQLLDNPDKIDLYQTFQEILKATLQYQSNTHF